MNVNLSWEVWKDLKMGFLKELHKKVPPGVVLLVVALVWDVGNMSGFLIFWALETLTTWLCISLKRTNSLESGKPVNKINSQNIIYSSTSWWSQWSPGWWSRNPIGNISQVWYSSPPTLLLYFPDCWSPSSAVPWLLSGRFTGFFMSPKILRTPLFPSNSEFGIGIVRPKINLR